MTRKKNGKPIHSGRMVISNPDTLALGVAVEERFVQLCQLYKSATGNQLTIPSELDRAMFNWRKMRVRHKRNDFRHTDSELQATREIAQWTLDKKTELCGQPSKKLEWS